MKPGAAPVGADRLSAREPDRASARRRSRIACSCRGCTSSWLTPAHFAPGDAELDVAVAAAGRRQELAALQAARLRPADRAGRRAPSRRRQALELASSRSSSRRGRRAARPPRAIDRIRAIVDEEIAKLQQTPPADARVRARDQPDRSRRSTTAWSASADFGGKGDQLNGYYFADRQSRLLQRGPVALPRAVADRHPGGRAAVPAADQRVELIVEPVEAVQRTDGLTSRGRRGTRLEGSGRGPACSLRLASRSAGARAQQAPDRSKPPALGPLPALKLPPIEKRTLSNGLPVWIVEMHKVPVVHVDAGRQARAARPIPPASSASRA